MMDPDVQPRALSLEQKWAIVLVELDTADTMEHGEQRGLKALISVDDGPRPGETGFLRLFAHPKTVAVRTLHHGAELEIA